MSPRLKKADHLLAIILGVIAVVLAIVEHGFTGLVTAWVLMRFGSIWRPAFEQWIKKKTEKQNDPRTT